MKQAARGKQQEAGGQPPATNGQQLTASSQQPPGKGRWLILVGGLLTLAGYFGPWVDHRVAGLVITGLDMGEYVKFLPAIRGLQILLWREGFYLPLLTVSLTYSLYAYRPALRYPAWLRASMLLVASAAALNLLPPAWSPAVLFTPGFGLQPEFRLQTLWIGGLLLAVAISPLLALLPRWSSAVMVTLLCAGALWWPISNFLRVLPGISELYHHPLTPGWGVWTMIIGLIVLGGSALATRE